MLKKVKAACQEGVVLRNPEWNSPDNVPHLNAIDRLAAAIMREFPNAFDTSKVTACKQKPDEDVADFLHCLMTACRNYGGHAEPAGHAQMSTWEQQLCGYFRDGLLTPISEAAKRSCIGWKKAHLADLQTHAEHAPWNAIAPEPPKTRGNAAKTGPTPS